MKAVVFTWFAQAWSNQGALTLNCKEKKQKQKNFKKTQKKYT